MYQTKKKNFFFNRKFFSQSQFITLTVIGRYSCGCNKSNKILRKMAVHMSVKVLRTEFFFCLFSLNVEAQGCLLNPKCLIYLLKVYKMTEENSTKARKWPNLSFSGAGFLGIYHVGVASCILVS